MRKPVRWATTVVVAATAVALGLSSASATTPIPAPGPPLPAAAPGPAPAGTVVNPAAAAPARTESLFTAVAPCRIADTRKAVGPLANLAVRNFYVRGTTHFAPQGGTSGGCGIPSAATAVATNVTVAGASGSGYLSGYPNGTGEPNTNFITYQGGQNITANPVLPLAAGLTPDLSIRNHGTSSAQVIIDVTGYYVPQIDAVLTSDGTATYADGVARNNAGNRLGSPRVLKSVRTSTGLYTVTLDSDIYGCTPMASVYGGGPYVASAYIDVNTTTVYASTYNLSGTPTNLYWELHIMC